MTSPLQTIRHPYPTRARVLSVAASETLSPTMRRFHLTGDQLEPDFPHLTLATASHVKVVVPQEDTGRLVMPTLGEHGLRAPDGVEIAVRDYTVRRFDPAARLLTLDFVLHEDGPAGRWALSAHEGDRLGVVGPRSCKVYPTGCHRYVLGADQTALPALERWLEEAPPQAHVDAFVLAPELARRPLPDRPDLHLQWIDGPDSSDTGHLAAALVDALPAPDPGTFFWAAGEAGLIATLRHHLSGIGLPRHAFHVSGYWRSGRPGSGDQRDGVGA